METPALFSFLFFQPYILPSAPSPDLVIPLLSTSCSRRDSLLDPARPYTPAPPYPISPAIYTCLVTVTS